jgi:hypothetical protein
VINSGLFFVLPVSVIRSCMATHGFGAHTSDEDTGLHSFFTCPFAHSVEDQDVEITMSESECSNLPVNNGDFNVLPPEIFIEIFRLCSNDDLEDGRMLSQTNDKPEIINGPWNLSQVCAHWRALCLSTPSLWTTITICSETVELKDIHPSLGAVALLEEGLRRCGDSDLFVSIEGVCLQIGWIKPFIPYCSQWKSLTLVIASTSSESSPRAWNSALSPVLHKLPRLQLLAVFMAVSHEVIAQMELEDFTGLTIFQDAPRLQNVEIHLLHWAPYTVELPWSVLTTLTLHFVRDKCFVSMLKQSYNLRALTIEGPMALSGDHVHHIGLQSLETEWTSILVSMTLPSLRTLRTTVRDVQAADPSNFDEDQTSDQVNHVVNFVIRSQCSLTSLSLIMDSLRVTSVHLHALLRVCPSLTQLFIFALELATLEELIKLLTRRSDDLIMNDNNPYLLPGLQTLNMYLIAHPPSKLTAPDLLLPLLDSFILSRRTENKQMLQGIRLYAPNYDSETLIRAARVYESQFKRWHAEGLRLFICSGMLVTSGRVYLQADQQLS